jgi:signal transduction histidine kinase
MIFVRLCLVWFLFLASLNACAYEQHPPSVENLHITSARAEFSVDGQRIESTVQLPFAWDKQFPNKSGNAILDIDFTFDSPVRQLYGLYVTKISNAYRITLNGVVLDQEGSLNQFNTSETKLPRVFAIPIGMLQASNHLRIEFRADAGRQAGVTEPIFAPYQQAKAIYSERWQLRFLIPVSVAIFSTLIGLVGTLLWLTQMQLDKSGRHRRDSIYLFVALAEFFWVFRLISSVTELPPLSLTTFATLSSVSLGAWGCCMALFGTNLAKHHLLHTRFLTAVYAGVVVLMIGGLGASIAAWNFGHAWALTAWYASLLVCFLSYSLIFIRLALTPNTNWQIRLFAATIIVNVLSGLLDLYFFRISPNSKWVSSIYVSSAFFGLSSICIALARFRTLALNAHTHANEIITRLDLQKQDLSQTYERKEAIAREYERSAERTRILRDMHDGVGSHISLAIRQLQLGQRIGDGDGRNEVLLTLRDALDQLKLSIDAMSLPPGDITALLANLRYRLGARITASGIQLQWDVDLLPTLTCLDANAMRQLQFLLFESLSNVLQHAHAKTLCIEAHAEKVSTAGDDHVVRIRVVDDGVGFDVQSTKNKGLLSMYERATVIGAQLTISSTLGCTVVEIQFGRDSNI